MNITQKTNIFIGTSLTTLALVSSSVFAAQAFSDIGGRADTEAIEYLKQRYIVNGFKDGTYKPEQPITRAEFTKILLNTAQISINKCSKKEVNNISTIFSDVNSSDWFAEYVCTAQKSGLVKGYNDNTFRPNVAINVAESAKIITLSQGEKLIDITSAEKEAGENAQWFEKYIIALQNENAINSDLIGDENSSLNRGAMADIIWHVSTGKEVTETNEPLEISSCAVLEKQINKSKQRNSGGMYFRNNIPMDSVSVMESDNFSPPSKALFKSKSITTESLGGTEPADDFSTTNIQEIGVDEADIIKNDGSHIFIARNGEIRIVKAYPQNEMTEDAVISINNMHIKELFLSGDTLVATGYKKALPYTNKELKMKKIASPYYNSISTEVRVFDISDRKNPIETRSVSLEGHIVSSRKIGDILYLITNQDLYNYSTKDQLPAFSDNGAISQIAKCDQISYFPNFTSQNLTTIAAINVKNTEEKITFKSILGAGNNIYSSLHNLFIVQSDSKQEFITNQQGSNTVAYWDWKNISRISKFSLNKTSVDFVAQTEVDGSVLNKYSMSEFEDNFRIATHVNSQWRNRTTDPSYNIVTILDKNLKKSGEIRNIAEGENIKSVRFMGNRGFVVTFKSIDPLFVIDMNPTNPKIVGELKIPGWSDYLHPIDENYLIGFGKEVNAESANNERLTWDMLMGMKISIFDVSDLKNPKEIHKTVIGDKGTDSEILRNPKALFFDAERKLIGFPVQITKIIPNNQEFCKPIEPQVCECKTLDDGNTVCPSCPAITATDCIDMPEETKRVFSGAQLYSFDIHSGFKLEGAVSHFPDYIKIYWDYAYTIKRLVRIGENMYSISNDMIKGLDMHLKKDTSKEVLFTKAGTCSEIEDVSSCMNRQECEPLFVQYPCDEGAICIQQAIFDSCAKIQ